ncbi:MAG: outer membrane protein transport protein [Planctomycetaceae bacterium]|nr:outer membrane protein transport protein [Planctomycetaceae bacterium]
MKYRLLLVFLFAVPVCAPGRTLFAQELGYTGVSPVNNSFGGVAVAAPIDGTAAIYWNPATISSLDQGEFQFGFGRTNPPWCGDESIGYTILVPVIGALWLYSEANKAADDYWDQNYGKSTSNKYDAPTPPKEPVVDDSPGLPTVRSFHISYVTKPSRYSHWNYGFAMTEMGQRKQRFLLNSATGEVKGVQVYRVKTIELTPAVSWWNKRNLSFGISPVLSIDEHPNASLPSSRDSTFLGNERGHVGLGLQLGVYYQTGNDFGFGFSVKSPSWIPRQTYHWENTGDGSLYVHRSHFSQDTPLRFAFGISYSGVTNGVFAIDVRHYDFQHVNSLYDFSSNGKKRTATSFGAGMQYHILPGVVVRAGYQYTNGNCNSFDDLVFNTTLPIQHGHSIHYGLSFGDLEYWDLTFSGSNSFGNQKIRMPDGKTLDANPNNSTFWWGLRIFF